MPATTPLGFVYPLPSDGPNIPLHVQAGMTSIDTFLTGQTPGAKKQWWGFQNAVLTDGSGYVTITHNAGFTPTVGIATPSSPITSSLAASIFGFALVDTFTSTTVRVRCLFANATQI